MRMRNYLGLLALLIFSAPVFSADYTYRCYLAGCTMQTTPQAAAEQAGVISDRSSFVVQSCAWSTGTTYLCPSTYISNGTTQNWNVTVYRFGDNCPAGSTYNATTRLCETPYADQGKLCPDQSGATADIPKIYDKGGQCVLFSDADQETTCKFLGNASTSKNVMVRGTINDQGEAVPPPAVKDSGCAATIVASQCVVVPAKIVKSNHSDQPAAIPGGAKCAVEIKYTGAVAAQVIPENLQAAKDDVCVDPGKCNLPEPQQNTEKKPCTYVTAPDGSQTCVSTSGIAKEGKTQCGTVNGVLTCSDSLAKPVGNGMIVWTKVNSVGLGDGKTQITKTDTMTTYSCGSGKSTCTSSNTTNTTITIKDGNGNTESVTGSCTGKACPDKNTNPDGDGDGFGDCIGGDCSQEEGGSPDLPGMGEVDSYQVTTQKFYDRVKSSPIASSVSNISVPSGGSAPEFTTGGLEALGGVSLDFSIIGTLFDGVKSILSAVMKAFWCFVAVFIFLNA